MPHRFSTTRTLPENPSLAQLRKQAKELLKAYRSGDEAALCEVERFERDPDPAQFVLRDAQRVLARAYGFSSWTRLKQHVDGLHLDAFCQAAENGDVASVLKMAKTRPELVNRDAAEFRASALHRAVVKRNAEVTRVLMELGADLLEPLDLGFSKCRMVVAGKPEIERKLDNVLSPVRVASKFPRVAQHYFRKRGVPFTVFKLSGSV